MTNMARFLENYGKNNLTMLPSMTINQDSKTPYTDATQVSEMFTKYFLIFRGGLTRKLIFL